MLVRFFDLNYKVKFNTGIRMITYIAKLYYHKLEYNKHRSITIEIAESLFLAQ